MFAVGLGTVAKKTLATLAPNGSGEVSAQG
jgi:hypothetical protein